MKLSKTLLLAIGGLTIAGLGCLYKLMTEHRRKLEEEFLEQELKTLENEGGICLT